MTDGFGWDPSTAAATATRWDELSEMMARTKTDLGGASTSGFAPSVAAAASGFLKSWSGFAGESSDIAAGFSTALHDSSQLYDQTDQASHKEFQAIDGRLGPAL